MKQRWLLLAGCILAGSALASCSKRSAAPVSQTNGAAQESISSSRNFVNGAGQTEIRALLSSVREVKPSKFDVEWSADTVAVSREEAMRSLRAVSADGSSFTFATAEPVVRKLQPGRIVWIWGIAIRRIDKIGILDDATVLYTRPVALGEAMTRADIEFEAPLNFADGYGVYQPYVPEPGAAAKKISGLQRTSPFMPVVLQQPSEEPGAPPPGGTPEGAPDESDVVVQSQAGYTGRILGFEYSLAYRATSSDLMLELQARRLEEGKPGTPEGKEMSRDERDEYFEYVREQRTAEKEAGESAAKLAKLQYDLSLLTAQAGPQLTPNPNATGPAKAAQDLLIKKDEEEIAQIKGKYHEEEAEAKAAENKAKNLAMAGALAKQVFFIISDNLDVRFRAKAKISRAAIDAAIKMTPVGLAAGTSVKFKDLKGHIDLEFIGRLGREGGGAISVPVVHIPLAFNMPIIVEGIPLIAQVAADFLVKLYLAGHHAAHHFAAGFDFSGTGGFTETAAAQVDGNMNFAGSEPEVEEQTAESPGVSGSVLAVQLPRLGLGVGTFGLAGIGYLDHVTVLTITNSAGVATLNPPCQRFTVDRVGSVGAELTTMIPIPILETLMRALSWRKEVWRAKQWKKVRPDIPMCRI